jgi:hypothetical protein
MNQYHQYSAKPTESLVWENTQSNPASPPTHFIRYNKEIKARRLNCPQARLTPTLFTNSRKGKERGGITEKQ